MAAAVAAADLNHKDTPHVLQPSDDLSLNTDAINQCMSDPTGYSVDDIPALLMPHIQPDPNNVTVKAGAFVSIGGRRYQEDRVVIIHDLNAFCAPNERESKFDGVQVILVIIVILQVAPTIWVFYVRLLSSSHTFYLFLSLFLSVSLFRYVTYTSIIFRCF